MRIIKRKTESFEKEITCPNCKSIFAFKYHDMYHYHDMDGDCCPAVKCPCCGYSIHLEGYKDLPCEQYSINFDSGDK